MGLTGNESRAFLLWFLVNEIFKSFLFPPLLSFFPLGIIFWLCGNGTKESVKSGLNFSGAIYFQVFPTFLHDLLSQKEIADYSELYLLCRPIV